MVSAKYVFDIPVYRKPQQEFESEMECERRKYLLGAFGPDDPTDHPLIAAKLEMHFDKRFSQPWDFNDIIGWIRLFASGQ